MEDAGHLLDFAERLSALTDMEAVKDAYLDYVASMFATYRVIRTPRSFPGGGLRLVDSSSELGQLHLMEDWESCLHDELICIIGRRGSLGRELGDWLERPRQIVHDRLERLLLKQPLEQDDVPGQSHFYRQLSSLDQPTFGFLVGIDGSKPEMLADRLGDWRTSLLSRLPPDTSRVFFFGHSEIVCLISTFTEPTLRSFVRAVVTGLADEIGLVDPAVRLRVGGARWPQDANTAPAYCRCLQQGWADAVRLAELEPGLPKRSYLVFASDRVNFAGGSDEGGHDGGVGARLGGPKGPLSAGAARHLPEL